MLNLRTKLDDLRRYLDEAAAPSARFRLNVSAYAAPSSGALRWVCMTLAGLLLLAIVGDGIELYGLSGEVAQLEQFVAHLHEQDEQIVAGASGEGVNLAESANAKLPTEVTFVNRLVEKRAFSWTRFLSELESAVPAGVGVGSVKLDPAGSVVHLSGTAGSFEAVTSFVGSLEEHPSFHEPVLQQHRDREDGQVEFTVTLFYRHAQS